MNNTWALILYLAVKSLYVPLNRKKCKYYWELPIDKNIPLLPVFIVPYLSYFPFIIVAIVFTWNTQYSLPLLHSLTISYVLAELFWFYIPNGVRRPNMVGNGVFHILTRFLYRIDGDGNGFPSAHVFISILCGYFLWKLFPPFGVLFVSIVLLIIVSTVLIKQHYVIDIPGGIGTAVVSLLIVSRLGLPV